jgi:mono/diheme cytochrome c family protein
MSRAREILTHPLWQTVLVLAGAYLVFAYGIPYLPPLVGVPSAPVPNSVLLQYMAIVAVGMLLHVSSDETRWRRFTRPLHATLVDADKRPVRGGLLVAVPLLLGYAAYASALPRVDAPIQLRSVHPAPPRQITVRGRTITLAGLENPLRGRGVMAEHLKTGRRIYYQNCVACHGDRLDGQGHFAHGFSPTPASFTDNGTIAQLTESYVFWRIAKGGPGLPREGTPWNSAMPVWENFLTEDEMWAVVLYIYEQSGWKPRRFEAAAEEHLNPPGQRQKVPAPGTPAPTVPAPTQGTKADTGGTP